MRALQTLVHEMDVEDSSERSVETLVQSDFVDHWQEFKRFLVSHLRRHAETSRGSKLWRLQSNVVVEKEEALVET